MISPMYRKIENGPNHEPDILDRIYRSGFIHPWIVRPLAPARHGGRCPHGIATLEIPGLENGRLKNHSEDG